MARIDEGRIFRSSDLYLCAFLVAKGAELWATDASNPNRVEFLLKPRPKPKDLEAWAGGWATVNAGEYSRMLRHLKKALWQAKDGRK
jgi:hypothetical protein